MSRRQMWVSAARWVVHTPAALAWPAVAVAVTIGLDLAGHRLASVLVGVLLGWPYTLLVGVHVWSCRPCPRGADERQAVVDEAPIGGTR